MSQREEQVLLETETVFPVREGPVWAFHSQDGNTSGEEWWGEKNQVQGWPWAGHPSQLEEKLSSEQRRVLPHSQPKKGSGGLFLSFLKSQPGGETADCRQEPCCLLPQALSPTPASQEEACPSGHGPCCQDHCTTALKSVGSIPTDQRPTAACALANDKEGLVCKCLETRQLSGRWHGTGWKRENRKEETINLDLKREMDCWHP